MTKEQQAAVDAYLATFDGEVRRRLDTIRKIIRTAVPEAQEQMSYGLACYKLGGKPLVYFGGFDQHVGLYATPNGHEAFQAEFAAYKHGKGSVQFPHNQPLPVDLVKRVVLHNKQQREQGSL